ncbi:MAG: MoxR family ATPase [Bacillota bacterium]
MVLSIPELQQALEREGYICDREQVVTIYLALKLGKPLLIEGVPGVGKTEVGKVLSRVFRTELIRLQCYEGLDENKALYEWNYQRQLLKIQVLKETGCAAIDETSLFGPEYLLERPLLKAIRADRRVVLLIDECDKVDEPFEAFLFELLSDFQVSIPELGTLTARQIPIVVLTSNGERELSDGLRRRCVYLYLDYPSVEKEMRILETKVPEAGERLIRQIALVVNYLRSHLDLKKQPSIAESLDWARALVTLNASSLTEENMLCTLNILLKNRGDQDILRSKVGLASILKNSGEGELGAQAAEKPACTCACTMHN